MVAIGGGGEVKLLLFLKLGARRGFVVSFTPRNGPPVPIVHEAGWVLEHVGTQRLEEKFATSVREWTRVVELVVRHCTDRATQLT
jgi:hypothetical protein